MEAEAMVYDKALKGMFAMAALTVVSTAIITAPYGRHSRSGWGPTIGGRMAWCLMESPTLWLSALLFPLGRSAANPTSLLLLGFFLLHYVQRTLIYPLFRLPSPAKPVPFTIAALAFIFNCYNTFLQVRWISHFGNYTTAWLWNPVFILGLGIFLAGMYINIWADSVLLSLRKDKEEDGSYKIPRGGLYEYVSCPNYFGEIVEWMGWAIMTWSLPGLAFFLYTASNLGPRALAHHAWYLDKFPGDYPKCRRALVPFVY